MGLGVKFEVRKSIWHLYSKMLPDCGANMRNLPPTMIQRLKENPEKSVILQNEINGLIKSCSCKKANTQQFNFITI